MLGDHDLFFTLSSFQGSGLGNLFQNVNGSVFYLNQAHRINWGLGAFRLRGLVLRRRPEQRSFRRAPSAYWDSSAIRSRAIAAIEAQYSLEHSDRFDIGGISSYANDLKRPRAGRLARVELPQPTSKTTPSGSAPDRLTAGD